MSKRDFLLEIGVEEIPARFVQAAEEQLREKVEKWLKAHALTYTQIISYATPRRLALLIQDLAERQADRQEEAKGPSKKIALDENGNWSKAAQGFARSQGVSLEALTFREIKGVEYIYVLKEIKGLETEELLPQIKEIITGLTFPKNMRWGAHELRFVRPLKWLVALYGETVIPFEITGVKTNRETQGHRFLGKTFSLTEPRTYAEQLRKQYVITSSAERQTMIVEQLKTLEKEQGWQIPVDQDLLEEVTHLVEYPTAIYGSFEQEFLEIPSEVLITSMKEHQRYFPVKDHQGNLLPYFVTIRNGTEDSQGLIARGNEKVIRARLADARFFYEEDKKLEIKTALAQLDNIVFHEDLGSVGDKVRRVRKLANSIAQALQVDETVQAKIDRAAEICKFDLVSLMVGEFPELQGIMGEKYAGLAGEDAEVSQAVREHYLPRFAGDELPEGTVGAILSVADKLDTLIGCFGIGIHPTGSQDPYALRRQATGIVQIMLAEAWPLTLEELFNFGLVIFSDHNLMRENEQEVIKELGQFFHLRLKNRLQEEGIRYDIVEASLLGYTNTKLSSLFVKAHLLVQEVEKETFKPLVEAFTRVKNLADKLEQEVEEVRQDLFTGDAELHLLSAFTKVEKSYTEYAKEGNWSKAFQALAELQQPIEHFFEQTMVMVDEAEVRNNRLALLQKISRLIQRFADFSHIVFSSK